MFGLDQSIMKSEWKELQIDVSWHHPYGFEGKTFRTSSIVAEKYRNGFTLSIVREDQGARS